MRCIAVQYDASFPSPKQPSAGPRRVPRADSCNRIFDDPQCSDAITARCIRAPFTHERFSPKRVIKRAQLKLSSNRDALALVRNEDMYFRKYLIANKLTLFVAILTSNAYFYQCKLLYTQFTSFCILSYL